jgi:hypothetical protein
MPTSLGADTDPLSNGIDQLNEMSKGSVEKLHSMVDDLRSVEEHEKTLLDDEDPPSGPTSTD